MSIVAQHYEQTNLVDRLKTALTAAGLANKQLTSQELAPLDHFHARGFAATVDLANSLPITSNTRVLDLGSGVGGPARFLAEKYGCHVIGIDITPSFVEAATFLTERSGLAGKVSFQCADALALPFPDASFDLVMTQHVAMNIANRKKFYAEAFRVLRPGGNFAFYDVIAGSNSPLIFPVPWAITPEASHLLTAEEMRTHLTDQGFQVLTWQDRTAAGIAWFAEMQNQLANISARPPLGQHVVVGPDFKLQAANLARNLHEFRAALLESTLLRP